MGRRSGSFRTLNAIIRRTHARRIRRSCAPSHARAGVTQRALEPLRDSTSTAIPKAYGRRKRSNWLDPRRQRKARRGRGELPGTPTRSGSRSLQNEQRLTVVFGSSSWPFPPETTSGAANEVALPSVRGAEVTGIVPHGSGERAPVRARTVRSPAARRSPPATTPARMHPRVAKRPCLSLPNDRFGHKGVQVESSRLAQTLAASTRCAVGAEAFSPAASALPPKTPARRRLRARVQQPFAKRSEGDRAERNDDDDDDDEFANISVVRVDVHEEIVVVLVVGNGEVACVVAALQRGFGQNLPPTRLARAAVARVGRTARSGLPRLLPPARAGYLGAVLMRQTLIPNSFSALRKAIFSLSLRGSSTARNQSVPCLMLSMKG
jgi:hypothetical protein